MKLQSAYPTIRLLVACVLLAIGLRTWLIMGLIEPVNVAGSSMVPSHRGNFVEPQCPVCKQSFRVGAEFAVNVESMRCPTCSKAEVPMAGLSIQRGDRLWIDRLSLKWREPRRWETIVARNPTDGNELCIKRIAGLPGEQVDLSGGNLRIDGAIFVKSLEDQYLVRQLLHTETSRNRRWFPTETTRWQRSGATWEHPARQQADVDWLSYRHPRGELITDDVSNNAGLTRKLNLVDEFLLSFDLRVTGNGAILLSINDGTSTAQMSLSLPTGSLELIESSMTRSVFEVEQSVLDALDQQTVLVEVTNFDQQLLLVIDGRVVLRRPWPNTPAAGTAAPFAVGTEGLGLTLSNLTLYRDIYYSAYPVGAAPPAARRWLLGPGEYFLLGDNPPVSIDSRLWGPVSDRLIIGKPL